MEMEAPVEAPVDISSDEMPVDEPAPPAPKAMPLPLTADEQWCEHLIPNSLRLQPGQRYPFPLEVQIQKVANTNVFSSMLCCNTFDVCSELHCSKHQGCKYSITSPSNLSSISFISISQRSLSSVS